MDRSSADRTKAQSLSPLLEKCGAALTGAAWIPARVRVSRWALPAGGALLLAPLLFLLLPSSVPVRKLPDGTEILLVSITSGSGLFADFRSPVDRLRQDLVEHGFTLGASKPPVPLLPTSSGPELVFWTDSPHQSTGSLLRCSLVDESGHRWPGSPVVQISGITAWRIPAFPRRNRRLTLRLENDSGSTEFPIRNPLPRQFPSLTAEPLPASREAGDLTFKLLSLETGLPTRAAGSASGTPPGRTRVVFQILQEGKPAPLWEPYALEFSDGTGNLLGDIRLDDVHWGADGTVTAEGAGAPAAVEPVWEVTAGFRPRAPGGPQQAALRSVLLPPPGKLVPFPAQISFRSTEMRLQSIEERTEGMRLRPERARGYEIRGWITNRKRTPQILETRDDLGRDAVWSVVLSSTQDGKADLESSVGLVRIRFAVRPGARSVQIRLREALAPPSAVGAKEAEFLVPAHLAGSQAASSR